MHVRKLADGTNERFTFNPYQIVYDMLPNGKVVKLRASQMEEWERMKKSYQDGTMTAPDERSLMSQLMD